MSEGGGKGEGGSEGGKGERGRERGGGGKESNIVANPKSIDLIKGVY